jgi:hypothetical protein
MSFQLRSCSSWSRGFVSVQSSTHEAKRTLLFVSKKQRDAFVEELATMNPKLVVRKADGSLAAPEPKAPKVRRQTNERSNYHAPSRRR